MATRRQHTIAGVAVGVGAALFQVWPDAPPLEALLEAIGGSGRDWITRKPPLKPRPSSSRRRAPNHRNVAHSVAANTALHAEAREADRALP